MTNKVKIRLALVLPSVPNAHDACIRRLNDSLKSQQGILSAHLVSRHDVSSDQGLEEVCIHYDPDQLSIAQVREIAHRAGAELELRYGHLLITSETMYAKQALSIEARAKHLTGVMEAAVSPAGVIGIEFDRNLSDEEKIREGLRKLGVRIVHAKPESDLHPPGTVGAPAHVMEHRRYGPFGERTELRFAAICGALLLGGFVISYANVNPWVPIVFYLGSYTFGGFFTLREAAKSMRVGRFEIDFLMLVAAIGAATLGKWAEGSLLLFLFSLGHALEHYAMGRAKRAIEALAELAPQTALVRRNGLIQELPVEQLRVEDIVVIKPNERMPADGFVVLGEGSVNQAPITGESLPVEKRPVGDRIQAAADPDRLDGQHRVFAGTINNNGSLEIQVTKLASDSTLARVVQMVKVAETQKSPTQRFTDKFERYFVPVVLGSVVALLFAWVVIAEPFSASFYRAMAVLVAASPCALAISTPSAVLSGVARAARGGVLIKGGAPLENLGRLGAIAFDKTGTLTVGQPSLTDVVCAEGVTEEELLQVAVAVESLSDHPLAAAVVRGAKERLTTEVVRQAHDVESITGRGVRAIVDGQEVAIGKDSLFAEIGGTPLTEQLQKAVATLKSNGRSTMVVRQGATYLGALGLMDTPRDAARDVIRRLRQVGIQRMVMLSGDNQQVADAVGRAVGIDEAIGDLMPADKVEAIKRLGSQGGVAMVGDGVNDAPAMANATVGIAMGAAGSDVALETADVALMADDLSHLPFAVGLSRQTSRIIRQNLWISLGMVAFLVPATLLGLRLGPAVLLHEGSTLVVVLNALRLLGYQDRSTHT